MVFSCFKVPACAVIQLFDAIGTTRNAGEHICLACPRLAAFVLPQFLHPFLSVKVNNRFMGVLKHKLFFFGVVTGFLALVGLFISLEVYRMSLMFRTP